MGQKSTKKRPQNNQGLRIYVTTNMGFMFELNHEQTALFQTMLRNRLIIYKRHRKGLKNTSLTICPFCFFRPPKRTWLGFPHLVGWNYKIKDFNGKFCFTLLRYNWRPYSKKNKTKKKLHHKFKFWIRMTKTNFLPLPCVCAGNIQCVHASLSPQWT